MRLLVCGDRHWTNIDIIRRELKKYPKDTVIIHGCAKGADILSKIVAIELGMEYKRFPADWDKYGHNKGSPAGPIRNRKMLNEGKPDKVLAFHEDINRSVGTKDMVNIATKARVLVEIITK